MYDQQQDKCAELTVVREGEELHLEVQAPAGCTVELWNLTVKEAEGAEITTEGNKTVLKPTADKIICR